MGHLIEAFITGCPLCNEAINLVKDYMCPECRLVVYNVLENPEHMEKVRRYNVKALPAIIIDGTTKFEGIPKPEELKEALG